MRLPQEYLDCVVFICSPGERKRPDGTAFFVSVPDEVEPHIEWIYLVTANHSLDEISGQRVVVRVTATQGGHLEHLSTRKDDWFRHDLADVAVLPIPNPEVYKFRSLPLFMFIDRDYHWIPHQIGANYERSIKHRYNSLAVPVELGDQVFFPGLFVQSAGQNRNLPIFRFGNISRMPGDELVRIHTRLGDLKIRAYLTEAHSWGGHSGSPVIWYHEFHTKENLPSDEQDSVSNPRLHLTGLLGLVSAHFDIPIPTTGIPSKLETKLNSGIAVITPSENIRELLMRDDVRADRVRLSDRSRREAEEQQAATADSALTSKEKNRDIPIPPITRKKFFSDLSKATGRKS
ncbi:MAG: hypothetical protein WA740_17935 [Candidatus Binataceae bacterium]